MQNWQACLVALLLLSVEAQAGYTHYFTWHQKPDGPALEQCITEMRHVIEARQNILAGPEGTGSVEISQTQVELNGQGEAAHEPFVFPGEGSDNFCKTEGKPYDEVVTACLLIAHDHFPAAVLEISSDGSWEQGDWRKGADLYASVLGRQPSNPLAADSSKLALTTHPPKSAWQWALVSFALIVAALVFWRRRTRHRSG